MVSNSSCVKRKIKNGSAKVDSPYLVAFLMRNLCLSGIWLGVPPRTANKKTCVQKRVDYVIKI